MPSYKHRGVHLFSFKENGDLATINAISSGYIINVLGDGACTVVANGTEFSFYPLHGSISPNRNDISIYIKSWHYNGQQGFYILREIVAPTIDLWNQQDGFETRTHAGYSYKFFVPKGHEVKGNKDVYR